MKTVTQQSSSSRHVASNDILIRYNAHTISNDNINELIFSDDCCGVVNKCEKLTSQRDCLLSETTGIAIHRWEIKTNSSSIATEAEMDELTCILQDLQNGSISHGISAPTNPSRFSENTKKNEVDKYEVIPSSEIGQNKRLCLPEIFFSKAFLSLKYNIILSSNSNEEPSEKNITSEHAEITFNAKDALCEWAECQSHLPHPQDISDAQDKSNQSYRGVSVLKTIDAKLWEDRHQKQLQKQFNNKHVPMNHSTEFHYDWTFSTPYCGTVFHSDKDLFWNPKSTSGFDLSLLTDQSVPILYFDNIRMYEDDMHDNGYVNLSCKIRVMPKCFFLLMSLFVRVDYVTIRVKEVRFFCKFDENGRVWRDVTWRECQWKDLETYGLPSKPAMWRSEEEGCDSSSLGGNRSHQQRLQMMIKRLPKSALPDDVPEYSFVDLQQQQNKK